MWDYVYLEERYAYVLLVSREWTQYDCLNFALRVKRDLRIGTLIVNWACGRRVSRSFINKTADRRKIKG